MLLVTCGCNVPLTPPFSVSWSVHATYLGYGIFMDFSEHGKLREFCRTSGKNCNQNVFCSSFRYLCKTAVERQTGLLFWSSDKQPRAPLTWSECRVTYLLVFIWNDCWWKSLLQLIFVAIIYGKVTLLLWKSLGIFYSHFVVLDVHLVWHRSNWSLSLCHRRLTDDVSDIGMSAVLSVTASTASVNHSGSVIVQLLSTIFYNMFFLVYGSYVNEIVWL